MPSVASGLPLSAENAVRELATVLMRMPNHASRSCKDAENGGEKNDNHVAIELP